jgi:threonine/homoserine/homoserine lactone efflux protein
VRNLSLIDGKDGNSSLSGKTLRVSLFFRYNSTMSFLGFLSSVVVISLSGVLAPGPITAATIGKGGQSPHAGAWIAVGHGIVEIPLMILISLGIGRFFTNPGVKVVFGVLGGLFLLFTAVGLLREIRRPSTATSMFSGSPLAAGIMLSLANPYFLIWWVTIGVALILQSWAFGVTGFVALCALHWSCDFVWDYFLSALSFNGGKFFGIWFQRAIFALCGVALLGIGGWFLYDAAVSFLA